MNAVEAAKHLSQIPTDSDCAKDAASLNNAIQKKLKADAAAKWALAYEKYNREQVMKEKTHQHGMDLDNRNMDMKEKQAQHNMDMDHRNMDYKENQGFELKKRAIAATKAIGVAYGKNQQPTNYTWINNRR